MIGFLFRPYFHGRLKTDAKMFGIPIVTILSDILSESWVRKEFLKLICPFRLLVDDINDYVETGNSDSEDTKMEEARPVSDDDSSSEDEKFQSQLGNDFEFHQIEERGICRGLETELKKPFFISGPVEILNFLVTWPKQMMRKYDIRRLSLLPEVFQQGVSAKSPRESVSVDKCLEAFLKEEPLGPEDMW